MGSQTFRLTIITVNLMNGSVGTLPDTAMRDAGSGTVRRDQRDENLERSCNVKNASVIELLLVSLLLKAQDY